MKTITFLLLICFCIESSWAIIIIKGQATSLEYGSEPYYLPQNSIISREATNLFITMDGVNKVCFLNTSPSPLFEQVSLVVILIDGIKTEWNCFPYRTTVFEARP